MGTLASSKISLNMLTAQAMLLLIFLLPRTTGQANLPTLPEAIQLFQLESMNNLRETIQSQEKEITEKKLQIVELKEEITAQDLLIGSITAENTQLREEFAAKSVDESEQCETEKTQLRTELAGEILKGETKCGEKRMEIESLNKREQERIGTTLQQCESTILYMGNVMLQHNKVMVESHNLLESQADTIKEANEEIKRRQNVPLICETAAKSTVLQAETITLSLMRSSLASALDLPKLSTSNLEQLDVAPFMLELMESYNEQTKTIENLQAVLEKDRIVEEHISELVEGLGNLTTAFMSATRP